MLDPYEVTIRLEKGHVADLMASLSHSTTLFQVINVRPVPLKAEPPPPRPPQSRIIANTNQHPGRTKLNAAKRKGGGAQPGLFKVPGKKCLTFIHQILLERPHTRLWTVETMTGALHGMSYTAPDGRHYPSLRYRLITVRQDINDESRAMRIGRIDGSVYPDGNTRYYSLDHFERSTEFPGEVLPRMKPRATPASPFFVGENNGQADIHQTK